MAEYNRPHLFQTHVTGPECDSRETFYEPDRLFSFDSVRFRISGMDELILAIIEAERQLDEKFAVLELLPPSIVEDGDGATIEVYGDGSYLMRRVSSEAGAG